MEYCIIIYNKTQALTYRFFYNSHKLHNFQSCLHNNRRVGHRVLFRSERIILLRSFKARNIILHSFFEFLATYETQKNDAFFCVLFLRT